MHGSADEESEAVPTTSIPTRPRARASGSRKDRRDTIKKARTGPAAAKAVTAGSRAGSRLPTQRMVAPRRPASNPEQLRVFHSVPATAPGCDDGPASGAVIVIPSVSSRR